MSNYRLSDCEKSLGFEMLENISLKTQIKELKRTIKWISEDKDWLEKENKRYREALGFYADEGTYEVAETLPPTDECQQPIEPVFKTVPIIYYDKGKEARKALEGEE